MSKSDEPTNSSRLRVGILWPYAKSSSLYLPWLVEEHPRLEFFVLKDYRKDNILLGLDVLVTHMHYRWDELSILEDVLQQGKTAVLVIADGVLEFRNSWQNPSVPDGSMLRPAFAHKIAAIGCGQARLLESWGNQGRCEVVGLPRLDSLADKNNWRSPIAAATQSSTTKQTRLLVCSATTPAFTDQQWKTTYQSFDDLRDCIEEWNRKNEHQLVVTWRVAEELTKHLGLPEQDSQDSLFEAIEKVDAVVTTPSTIQLEAMLSRKPTVLLSYFSTPTYLPSAWPVHCRDHIAEVLQDLTEGANPSRSNFQDGVLRDQLWIHDSATQRMLRLIQSMGDAARDARANQERITLPNQILSLVTQEPSVSDQQYSVWHNQTMAATLDPFAGERRQWLEDSATKAAMLRAESASEARAHVTRIETKMFGLQDNYEKSLEDKRIHIANQSKLLEEAAERHQELNQLLATRNAEFERVQQRLKDLSEARQEDHKMLSEANANAKAKQQRVNELRERTQDLTARIQHLQAELKSRPKTTDSHGSQLENLNGRIESLLESNQQLVQHNNSMKEKNSKLLENNSHLQEAVQQLRENNQRMSANTESMQQRIEKLIADQELLRERLQKTESNTQ